MTEEEERIADEGSMMCYRNWIGRLREKCGDLPERELYDLGVKERKPRLEPPAEVTIERAMMMTDDELRKAILSGKYDFGDVAMNILLTEEERRPLVTRVQ